MNWNYDNIDIDNNIDNKDYDHDKEDNDSDNNTNVKNDNCYFRGTLENTYKLVQNIV